MAKFLLTHDLGTSSDKATLYALNGELVAHDMTLEITTSIAQDATEVMSHFAYA